MLKMADAAAMSTAGCRLRWFWLQSCQMAPVSTNMIFAYVAEHLRAAVLSEGVAPSHGVAPQEAIWSALPTPLLDPCPMTTVS
jgi:hypothetical protein